MKKLLTGVLLLILLATPTFAELISYSDGTIEDTTNELVWTTAPLSKRTHSLATTFALSYSFAGSSDWALPSRAELAMLDVPTNSPRIYTEFTLGPVANWSLWTSETITQGNSVLSSRAYVYSFLDATSFTASVLQNYPFFLVHESGAYDYGLLDVDSKYLKDSDGKFLLGAIP